MEKLRENSQWYFDRSLTENYHFVFQLPWSSQFVRAARLVQTSIVSRIIKEPQQVRLFLSVVSGSEKKRQQKDRKPAVKNAVSLSGHHDSLIFISVFWRGFFFFSSIMTTDWNQIKRKKKIPTQSSKPPPDSGGMQRKTFTWLKQRYTPALKVCAWQPLRE